MVILDTDLNTDLIPGLTSSGYRERLAGALTQPRVQSPTQHGQARNSGLVIDLVTPVHR